ncbi:MAG: IS1 family transposase [Cyanobacteria bacterium P01_D01_bin.73]
MSNRRRMYNQFLLDRDRIISKTCMTRVKGENGYSRYYLARLRRKSFCYSKSIEMQKMSLRLLVHYLRHHEVPLPICHPDFLAGFCNADLVCGQSASKWRKLR